MEQNPPRTPPNRRSILAAGLSMAILGRGREGAAAREPADRTFVEPSGCGVEFRHPIPGLIGDLLSTERGDPKLSASVPHHEWYSEHIRRRFGAWGPLPRAYPPAGLAEGKPVDWLRERAIAAASRFVGYGYQHHHVPDWDPPADWPWKEACMGRNGKGFDCSNFTSFVYNQAFGIRMSSDVVRQSESIEAEADLGRRRLRLRRVELPESEGEGRFDALRTGDLVYIRGKPGGPVTHVVFWVGPIGRTASGVPLVLDSHGGEVKDDEGRPIPCGVHLRPFRPKSWYHRCASHAHRAFEGPEGGGGLRG